MAKVVQQKYLDAIITDTELQGKIAKATYPRRTAQTVLRWAKENHELLLLEPVQQVIREYFGLPKDADITEVIQIGSQQAIAG